jgi:hypothetical protein
VEKALSLLESSAHKMIKNITTHRNLRCITAEERNHLKSYLLFQHGRTKLARAREEDIANYLYNLYKPSLYRRIREKGEDISWEAVKNSKIVSKSMNPLFTAMMSGILVYDLKMVLIENLTRVDFMFSDNPVVFFNSFFNDIYPGDSTGFASKGLQIFYPLNSRPMLFLYDSNFYRSSNGDVVKVRMISDIQRLNGLQIINCDKNIYFEDASMKDRFIKRYKELKSKIPKHKQVYGSFQKVTAENGFTSEIIGISRPKIRYNLEKLSFLNHKKKAGRQYGLRDNKLVDLHIKILTAVRRGSIKSLEDLKTFLSSQE